MAHVGPLPILRSEPKDLRLALVSAGFSLAFLTLLCIFFDPRWETNDDVAMSMVAHGYGIAAVPSANIVFSNVLWGHLVESIPTIDGVLGYSIATLLVLLISSFSIAYLLSKLGVEQWISLLAACVVLCRPILFPQFTLNAGLLEVSSVLALLVYSETKAGWLLIAGAVLSVVAFLIRSQEFALVVLIALPTLWSRALHRDRRVVIACSVVVLAIIGASVWDHFCYSTPAWRYFATLDATRAPFTDFGIAKKIASDPQLLNRFGYSRNDIDLLGSFFFVDPVIFNPDKLRAMVSSLGAGHVFAGNVAATITSVGSLVSPEMLPLVALSATLLICAPSFELVGGWFLFLCALISMGFVGRGGLLRVDLPVVALLCILSIVNFRRQTQNKPARLGWWRRHLREVVLGLATAAMLGATASVLIPQAHRASQHVAEVQAAAAKFPSQVVVVWGGGLEYESLFPLLARDAGLRSIRIFPLGVFTYAPFSVGAIEEARGRGFVSRIRSERGLLMLATPEADLLGVWCSERFGGVLKRYMLQGAPLLEIDRYRCVEP